MLSSISKVCCDGRSECNGRGGRIVTFSAWMLSITTFRLLKKRENRSLTEEMDHEAVVVAVDVGGGIGLKLNSDVGHGGVELEVWPRAAVLAQDVRRQVVAIVEGQQVVLANMETITHIQEMVALLLNDKTEGFHVRSGVLCVVRAYCAQGL